MTWKPKSCYETEEEREAWQKGYNTFEAYRGPGTPLQDFLDVALEGKPVRFLGIHPLAKELLGELFEELPEHLQGPLIDGFGTALMENLQRR